MKARQQFFLTHCKFNSITENLNYCFSKNGYGKKNIEDIHVESGFDEIQCEAAV